MTDDLCTWSELRRTECDHCGAHPGSNIVLEPTTHTDTPPVGLTPLHRRRLPVLGASNYGSPDIHDMIDELTRPHGHREPVTVTREGGEVWSGHHITDVPALVHQLLAASPASSGAESRSAAVSKPNARIEAIDTLMLIDDEAARWVRRLGENDPGDRYDPDTKRPVPGSGTIACLQKLHALHASQDTCGREKPHRSEAGRPDCCTRHTIEHDVRRWWRQARVISGWDSAAWKPRNSCPICEHRGGIRINLLEQAAVCIECRSVWGPGELGLLAEWIRTENADDDAGDTPTETSSVA